MLANWIVAAPAAAQPMKMDEMVRDCFVTDDASEDRQTDRLRCSAYVFGAFEMFLMMQERPLVCLPPGGLIGKQILNDLRSWVQRNPRDKRAPVTMVIRLAMLEAYRCPDPKPH